jgi:hypothetical protein
MIRSSKYHPFMVYLEPKEIKRLKKFSVKHKIPMTQIVREAIDARLSVGDSFTNGFNTGIDKAVEIVKAAQWAQMRFPSGISIAELIDQDLSDKKMRFFDDEKSDGSA